jgi:alpha-glucosidase
MMKENRIWWKHGVIYQIYPRSFYDSNDDGVGDIPGIIMKLDYLHDLGIDAVWLSPINCSPMYDFGYDISDYRSIDPIFGSMKDFDHLLKEAHQRGIKIILDLVMNHTSHLHPWFLASRSSRRSPKRDWYIWRDGKKGMPTNNWMSAFGGSAWEWDEMTGQYYLHSFLKEQPDVNWRSIKLREAMFSEIRFWLGRGVDGFRLDVVNWFIKDKHFRNNPPSFRPHQLQKHRYDRNRSETHDILRELRILLDGYDDRMAVGEIFTMPPGDPELSALYLGSGMDELHLAFDFSLIYRFWNSRQVFNAINNWMHAIPMEGWPCHVLSNHDQPRSMSRFGGGIDAMKRARVAAVLLMTLRGTPFIYYGEEIGMKNSRLTRQDLHDPLGKKYWPFFKGRDPARTPMQWSGDKNAGFSKNRSWLPVCEDYREVNVENNLHDPYSMLNFYRSLIHLRKEKSAMHSGTWEPLVKGRDSIIGYIRESSGQKIFVALNFSPKPKKVHIHERGQWKVIFSTHRFLREHLTDLSFPLSPYEATILEKIGNL